MNIIFLPSFRVEGQVRRDRSTVGNLFLFCFLSFLLEALLLLRNHHSSEGAHFFLKGNKHCMHLRRPTVSILYNLCSAVIFDDSYVAKVINAIKKLYKTLFLSFPLVLKFFLFFVMMHYSVFTCDGDIN